MTRACWVLCKPSSRKANQALKFFCALSICSTRLPFGHSLKSNSLLTIRSPLLSVCPPSPLPGGPGSQKARPAPPPWAAGGQAKRLPERWRLCQCCFRPTASNPRSGEAPDAPERCRDALHLGPAPEHLPEDADKPGAVPSATEIATTLGSAMADAAEIASAAIVEYAAGGAMSAATADGKRRASWPGM